MKNQLIFSIIGLVVIVLINVHYGVLAGVVLTKLENGTSISEIGAKNGCNAFRRATCHYKCARKLKACNVHTCTCYDNINENDILEANKIDITITVAVGGCDGFRRATCHYNCALKMKACNVHTCECYDNKEENALTGKEITIQHIPGFDVGGCDGFRRATCHYNCALKMKACNVHTCKCYDNDEKNELVKETKANKQIGTVSQSKNEVSGCDGFRRATCHYNCALKLKACDVHTCKCYDNENGGQKQFNEENNV